MKLLILVFTVLATASASYHPIHTKYHGPEHYPVIHKGVPVEPHAVQHARAEHLKTVQEIKQNHGGHDWIYNNGHEIEHTHHYGGDEDQYDHHNHQYEGQYDHKHDYEGQYNHNQHDYEYNGEHNYEHVGNNYYHQHEVPMLGHDGTPLDTIEVTAAKAKHFAAVNEALARNSHHYRHRRDAGYKVSTKLDKHGYSVHQEHASVYGHQEHGDVYAHDYSYNNKQYEHHGDDNEGQYNHELDLEGQYNHNHENEGQYAHDFQYDHHNHDNNGQYNHHNHDNEGQYNHYEHDNEGQDGHHEENYEQEHYHFGNDYHKQNGAPLDTVEVAAAKAKHFEAVNEALARNSHHYRRRRDAGYKVSTKVGKHGYSLHQEHATVYGHQKNYETYAHDYDYNQGNEGQYNHHTHYDEGQYNHEHEDEDQYNNKYDYEGQYAHDYSYKNEGQYDHHKHDSEGHYNHNKHDYEGQYNEEQEHDDYNHNHELSIHHHHHHHQTPQLGYDGTPLDTVEVAAAKAKHLAAVNEALARNSHHYRHRRDIGYKVSTKKDKHGYSVHQEHAPVYGHDGHVDYEKSGAYRNQLDEILDGDRNNGIFKLGHNKVVIAGDKHGLSNVIIEGYEHENSDEENVANGFEHGYEHQYQLFNGISHKNNGDKLVGMIYAETPNIHHTTGLDHEGRPLDTPEVQLAKAQHFLDYHQAANQGVGKRPVAPIDTPEVQIARALHLAAVDEVKTKHYY